MDEVLAVAMLSMQQDMTRVDRVALNLANVLTPAYKREVAGALAGGLVPQTFGHFWNQEMSSTVSALSGPNRAAATLLDMRAGMLESTGQGLDVALSGPGFFEVQTEQGPAYSRQGNFRLDQRGRLVTAQGYPVMAKGGEIYLTTGQPGIDAAGHVTDGEKALGQLKIVQFAQPENLQRLGQGLYASGTEMRQLADSEIQLRQGYLEKANVSSAHEMVELMQAMRHFESMQKVTQGYDDMIGTAIRKLGEM